MDARTRKRYEAWRRRKILQRLVVLSALLFLSITGHLLIGNLTGRAENDVGASNDDDLINLIQEEA